MLNTIQFFIFELNQMTHIGFEDKYSIYLDTESDVASWLCLGIRFTCYVFYGNTVIF